MISQMNIYSDCFSLNEACHRRDKAKEKGYEIGQDVFAVRDLYFNCGEHTIWQFAVIVRFDSSDPIDTIVKYMKSAKDAMND